MALSLIGEDIFIALTADAHHRVRAEIGLLQLLRIVLLQVLRQTVY